jgi:hypothetical protein
VRQNDEIVKITGTRVPHQASFRWCMRTVDMRWCQVIAPKPKPWLRILGLS